MDYGAEGGAWETGRRFRFWGARETYPCRPCGGWPLKSLERGGKGRQSVVGFSRTPTGTRQASMDEMAAKSQMQPLAQSHE